MRQKSSRNVSGDQGVGRVLQVLIPEVEVKAHTDLSNSKEIYLEWSNSRD